MTLSDLLKNQASFEAHFPACFWLASLSIFFAFQFQASLTTHSSSEQDHKIVHSPAFKAPYFSPVSGTLTKETWEFPESVISILKIPTHSPRDRSSALHKFNHTQMKFYKCQSRTSKFNALDMRFCQWDPTPLLFPNAGIPNSCSVHMEASALLWVPANPCMLSDTPALGRDVQGQQRRG